METLKICCDASVRYIGNRCFTCSGAVSINTGVTKYEILADSTNNRGELWAVYLGCRMALEERNRWPGRFERINVYSDSKLVIVGLTQWIHQWLKTAQKTTGGKYFNSSGKLVANQNMYQMIITFCCINQLEVHFYNQKGHVNVNSRESLEEANDQFFSVNRYWLDPQELILISNYNNYIDQTTRDRLRDINPNSFPVAYHNPDAVEPCHYVIPPNFRLYIHKGSEK